MRVSEHLAIYFEKLEDWEIEKLIRVCEEELEERHE